MPRKPAFATVIILTLGLALQAQTPQPLPGVLPLPEAINAFGLAFYKAAARNPGNLVFSPYNLAEGLSLVMLGARGETAASLGRTLHLDPQDQGLPARWKALRAGILAGKGSTTSLSFASALWLDTTLKVKPAYQGLVTEALGQGVNLRDIGHAPDRVVDEVNAWVSRETAGNIPRILGKGSLSPRTVLVLAEALYFRGKWREPFKKENSGPDIFHLSETEDATRAFMNLEGKAFRIIEDKDCVGVELPYGDGNLDLILIVPDRIEGLGPLEASLDLARLKAWESQLKPCSNVTLKIPNFKFRSKPEAMEILSALGNEGLFGMFADLSGIADEKPLYVGLLAHEATVKVDEEGTTATAATVISGVRGSQFAAPSHEWPFEVIADRPFLFYIRDRTNGTILFLGRITDPAEGS